MIDLAIALNLAENSLGEYGTTLFAGSSPIFGSGMVTNHSGIWVTATTIQSNQFTYTDNVLISTRYADVLEQDTALLNIEEWARKTPQPACELTTDPLIHASFEIIAVRFDNNAAGFSVDGIDDEGRYVKSYGFQIQYKIVQYPS